MASLRIGGLAVALGIGSAVVAGHGVASAEPSDGSSASGSSSTSSSSAESSSTESSSTGPSSGPSSPERAGPGREDDDEPSGRETGSASTEPDGDDAKADDDTPSAKKRPDTSRPSARAADPVAESTPGAASDRGERERPSTVETRDEPRETADVGSPPVTEPPAVTVAVVSTPAEPRPAVPVAPTPPPVEVTPPPVEVTPRPVEVTTALSVAVHTLLDGDVPTAPVESAAMWTLAAAARRELSAATTSVEQAADPVTTSLVTDTALAVPTVVAIEQIPPFGWLQQVPVLGPVLVTPLVAVLHQIPLVGDILHPFFGYPLQLGLPVGTPVPRDVKVISADGTPIYVHFMPAYGLTANQKAPTVLNGPGLGLPGATNLDGTLLDPILTDAVGLMSIRSLRQAGYNVVTWDPRGEWNSGGQLELNAAQFEGRDMSAIISWLATQPEVRLDAPGDPRLGMVGVSYGGGIQLVTAAGDKRVDAIVPAITYNRLDTSLYKNEAFKSSWATPLSLALTLTFARINPRLVPATIYGDVTGMVTQSDLDLLTSRNPLVGNITVPTLLIHGTVDTIFSLQEADATAQILLANGVPTKVVWFCGGHGVCVNNLFDLSDGALIERRTIEWLDRYVKGDTSVSTGPQFEWVDQRGQWLSSDTYPVSPGSTIVTSGGAGATLPLFPYLGGSGLPFIPFALKGSNALNLTVPKATATTYLVGAPELTLTYSGIGSSRHVYAQLVDDTTGAVLGSIVTPIPVTLDGTTRTVTVDLEPVAHTLRPGESVTLQLVSTAGLYERIIPSLGVLNVSDMALTLPTADPAAVSSPSAGPVVTAA